MKAKTTLEQSDPYLSKMCFPITECVEPSSKSSLENDGVLADYIGKSGSPEKIRQVKAHIAECEACWDSYIFAIKMLQDEETVKQEKPFKEFSAAMSERILNQITTLLEWILYPAIPEFAKAATPADTAPKIQARKFEKKFNGFKTVIVITKKDRHKVKIEVTLSDDTQNHDFFDAILERPPDKFDTMSLNDEGYAYFDDLPFAAYRFVLEQNGKPIGEFPFEIEEGGIYAIE
ncbi:hypothetical protein QUF90_05640 [Desulfococcaceae bacterium HSG9]|nr:hypothetical protein [Desulfococcaceae bacterium HSG9]